MSSEIHNNVCEICGKEELSGILSDNELRYSCNDHYLQVYQKIKEEKEKQNKK